MYTPDYLVKRYLPTYMLVGKTDALWLAAVRVVVLCSILPGAMVAVSLWEGTWVLNGSGRGLGEHYGYWAFFATTPLVVFLTWLIIRTWSTLLSQLPMYSRNGRLPTNIQALVEHQMEAVALKNRWRYLLWLFTIIAIYLVVLNIRRTINPLSIYGNDVFDAYQYRMSFMIAKVYLTFVYCFIYPSAILLSLQVTIGLIVLFRAMCEQDILRIDYFHADNCGGVSRFGSLNLMVMAMYASFGAVLLSLLRTHRYAQPINALPAFVLSALLIAQSTGAVYYIHRFVRTKKKEALQLINHQLNQEFMNIEETKRFPNDLLLVRHHIVSVRTYPYADTATFVVNGLRFAPAALGILRLIVAT